MHKSKIKICRSIGERIFSKCNRLTTLIPPGVRQGRGRRRKNLSEFGAQLKEKQKLKFSYGLREAQLKRYFRSAPQRLLEKLERRLDNTIFRLGLADSRNVARQLVSHGHVFVNDKRVNIPSYETKINDRIKLSKPPPELKEMLKKYQPAVWLSLNKETLEGKVVGLPSKGELSQAFNTQLVTEYYSR